MGIMIDFIANLGLETVKDKVTDVVAETQVKDQIKQFILKQQKINFHANLEEEIDFGGLAEYIQIELLDDVKKRCFGNKRERGDARQRIISKAVSFASAHTSLSADRTKKIVSTAVDMLSRFFRSRVNKDLLFITAEIEDVIGEECEQIQSIITRKSDHIEDLIRGNSFLSVDSSLSQIGIGELSTVEDRLGDFMNSISVKHNLFPYFGFRLTEKNKMISVPLMDEARKLYPESYRITASSVRLGNRSVKEMEKKLFDQAYRHQLPIYIDVANARKYLGDVLDPIQTEAEEMIGVHAIVKPPEFPKAFPCHVCIGEEVVVPYLLLRTKEILDDGTIIITNEEQLNFNFAISLRLMPALQKLNFTVQPLNPTNRECLNYRMFLKKAMSGDKVRVVASNLNENFIQGNIERQDIANLNEEIEFLEKIAIIEDYFCTTLNIPETITLGNHALINRLCNLIQKGYRGIADNFDFSFELNEENMKRILDMSETSYVLGYSAEGTFRIFEQDFVVPIFREIEAVSIENLNRLKEKVKALDAGDQIKIKFIPSAGEQNCKYVDRIKDENIENGLLFAKEK